MVFSPHIARKIAQESARKLANAEVARQAAKKTSKVHRRSTNQNQPLSNSSKVKVGRIRDESKRLGAERKKMSDKQIKSIIDSMRKKEGDSDLNTILPFSKKLDSFSFSVVENMKKKEYKLTAEAKADQDFLNIFGTKLSENSKKLIRSERIKKEKADQEKQSAHLDWMLKEYEQQDLKGPRRAPRSMVPSRMHKKNKTPSFFEQIQFEKQQPPSKLNEWEKANPLHEGKNKGALKDGRFREPMLRPGEQSYDPEMAKKWRGIGLGLGGAGILGGGSLYSGANAKKRPGTPNYGDYFG
jgi:hypothetical protein